MSRLEIRANRAALEKLSVGVQLHLAAAQIIIDVERL